MFRHKRPIAIGDNEFIVLMAFLISLVSLSMDTMLPALLVIGDDLGVADINHTQLIISVLFLGMAVGQVLYGPLSDCIGRKPAIYIGTSIFIGGCLLSMLATSFSYMLAGRLLQGLGIAGPRIVAVALIRDRYEGREMAKVMSFIMTLFIFAPIIAPALGQLLISISHWRVIFALFLLLALVSLAWLALRQPETLLVEKRLPWSFARVFRAMLEVCRNRVAFGYTLANGFLSGWFLAFLSSSPQILQQQYQLGTRFPLYFAALCLSLGVATLLNGRIVMRLGMRLLCHRALYTLFFLSLLYWLPAQAFDGHPPLWTYMTFLALSFFCIGIVFGNVNALAMQPLGHIAGVGAAVIGSITGFMAVPIATLIGHYYDGTILPLVFGFILCSLASIVVASWAERGDAYTDLPGGQN